MDLGFNLAQSNRDLKDLTSRQNFGDTSGLLCKNDLIPCLIVFQQQILRCTIFNFLRNCLILSKWVLILKNRITMSDVCFHWNLKLTCWLVACTGACWHTCLMMIWHVPEWVHYIKRRKVNIKKSWWGYVDKNRIY